MLSLINKLRSLLRGHERQVAEYLVATLALFIVGLAVITAYVDYVGVDERAARGASGPTMGALTFLVMYCIWRKRSIKLTRSARRWSLQRTLMAAVPHVLYLGLVLVGGVSYFYAQVGISLVWGAGIAFPVNYIIQDRWSLEETES